MTIPCSLFPLGTMIGPYKIGEVLCNISNGASKVIYLYPGIYYIRAQGAGGGGGRNGYFGNGQGGGSGAGFEGYLRIKGNVGKVTCTTGVGGAEAYDGNPGGNTKIGGIMTLGGGLGGAGENKEHVANEGLYTFNSNPGAWEIMSSTVARNGNRGIEATSSGSFKSGGDSVLTNSGGGLGNANATAPGAGGGGGYQWHINGGNGSYGECLIKFVKLY